MRHLYVAGQNLETREWIPVAELREVSNGFELSYTKGAERLPAFSGLSRMQALDKVYYSRTLFPFFANRLVSKSRPDYQHYLRWLGLDRDAATDLDMLAVTGGIRATDNYELFAPPKVKGRCIEIAFFPRGLRYLSPSSLAQFADLSEGNSTFLLKDVQNTRDAHALAIRTERPHVMFLGYVPRYYCPGLTRLLDSAGKKVEGHIKRMNHDAPLDMKVLLSFQAAIPEHFDVFSEIDDLRPLASRQTGEDSSF